MKITVVFLILEYIDIQKRMRTVIHNEWLTKETIRTVTCKHTEAAKFLVSNVLTAGKTYEVKNETDEFIFVVDNTGKIGGFYKTYFE